MITTRLIKHIVVVVRNIKEGTININYKAIIEVFIEVHFKVITKRSTIFIKSQIVSQLDTPLINIKRYITSFIKI